MPITLHGSSEVLVVSEAQAELHLAEAFGALQAFVAATVAAVAVGPEAVALLGPAPEFSYLLTQKQFDAVQRVCAHEGWPAITCRGIHISANTLTHPIDSRGRKDNCSAAEACLIVAKAYSPRSLVRVNRHRGQQAIFLNTHQRIDVGGSKYHAMAVVGVVHDGTRCYLTPITAYHANDSKSRALVANGL